MNIRFNGAATEKLNMEVLNITQEDIAKFRIFTANDLLRHLFENYEDTRSSYFTKNGEFDLGCICVINEEDWEIRGGEKSPVKFGDDIFLISSLHGG